MSAFKHPAAVPAAREWDRRRRSTHRIVSSHRGILASIMRHVLIAAACLLALLVGACAPPAPRPSEPVREAPADFPDAYYRGLAASGHVLFRVDPGRSLVVVQVYRAGSLARVGHDHVIASHDVRGYVVPDDGRADLYLRLDELVVDEPELRAEAKLETHPSAEDIAGTRRNMLNELEADRYPFVLVHMSGSGARGDSPLDAAITLHGVTRSAEAPVTIASAGDELSATGRIKLKQTDFGMKPLSVLGGALQVQDEVDLAFTIRARRMR
jgi:hypothetical protein